MNFIESNSYEEIIKNLHDGLYFVDRDRTITYWNQAAEKISGFTSNEVIGKSCSDNILTHVDSKGNSLCLGMCPLAEAIDDKQPREAEIYMHHKNGHRRALSSNGTENRNLCQNQKNVKTKVSNNVYF